MRLTRSLGVNLHPTSLPGGTLGPEAYAFVDWLAAAGAAFWQILPLNPPDEFGSPYASASAFACSPALLADPEAIVAPSELRRFEEENAYWIHDWVASAGADALAAQVRFEREWSGLRRYAAERGVQLVGDVPIYVAENSCDHVAHAEIFRPRDFVAGVPPDDLNEIGQKWGNPLYDWDALARDGYRWWIERLRRMFDLVDVVRIDHFRAFAGCWTVPVDAETARDGHWEAGPGAVVFRAAERELGELPVVVEDLGVITPDVEALRDELGFPGMAVILWAFQGPSDNPHRLENHRVHQVVYTSTHDTNTLAGTFPDRPAWELLELTLSSRAALAMVPVQDVLGLGAESRMNRPGEVGGNWTWQLEPGRLGREEAARLRAAAEAAGRASATL
jgi:4-alpha-glucanotransferase